MNDSVNFRVCSYIPTTTQESVKILTLILPDTVFNINPKATQNLINIKLL